MFRRAAFRAVAALRGDATVATPLPTASGPSSSFPSPSSPPPGSPECRSTGAGVCGISGRTAPTHSGGCWARIEQGCRGARSAPRRHLPSHGHGLGFPGLEAAGAMSSSWGGLGGARRGIRGSRGASQKKRDYYEVR